MSNLILPETRKGDGTGITGNYNEVEIYDAEHERISKEQMRVAQAIGTKLVKRYNNRQWKVIVDLKNCVLIIGCDSISNVKGYHIHTIGRTLHDLEELAVKAAGEILERHAISRDKKFNPDNLEGLIRDQFDNVITPDSKAEPI
jgi:hypothetical protein